MLHRVSQMPISICRFSRRSLGQQVARSASSSSNRTGTSTTTTTIGDPTTLHHPVFSSLTPEAPGLTDKQLEFFATNGFLHIPKALSVERCDELNRQALRYVTPKATSVQRSIFTTDQQLRKMNDRHFVDSANTISLFFEEQAFDKQDPQKLLVPLTKAINKLGHNLHGMDPLFQKVSFSPQVKSILKSMGYKRPVAAQSMFIFKQPGIGGRVQPHQDASYLATTPQSAVGFWWALEDSSLRNGCLHGVPGSHKSGIRQRMKRTQAFMEAVQKNQTASFKGDMLEYEPEQVEPFDLSKSVPIPTEKGDLVLLHHAFVHYSDHNHSDMSRHAYTLHVVESDGVKYNKDNWLQPPPYRKFPALY